MALDERALERMLRGDSRTAAAPEAVKPVLTDTTNEFEVYERPAQPGDPPKARGLRAHLYAPPAPPPPRPAPPAPAPKPAVPPVPVLSPPVPPPPAAEPIPEVHEPETPHPNPMAARTQVIHDGDSFGAPPEAPAPRPFEEPAPVPAPSAEPEPLLSPPEEKAVVAARPASVLDFVRTLPDVPAPAAPPAAPPPTPVRRFVIHEPAPAAPPASPPAPKPSTPHLPDAAPAARTGDKVRLAIVQAEFNEALTDMMAEWARRRAAELGCDVVAHVRVHGVFETPLAARLLCDRSDVDAVVVLACVIQGETGHDQIITHAAAEALQCVILETRKPVAFGVTGPRMTREQAEARVVVGKNAVDAAVKQVRVLKGITA